MNYLQQAYQTIGTEKRNLAINYNGTVVVVGAPDINEVKVFAIQSDGALMKIGNTINR